MMSNLDLSSSSRFARGNGHVRFEQDLVYKTTPDEMEPVFMGMFNLPFAEILHCKKIQADGQVEFLMPRYIVPDLERDGEGIITDGLNTLSHTLWGEIPPAEQLNPNWRDNLVTHLQERIQVHQLHLNPDKVLRYVGDLPKESERKHTIHGDATLANMVYDPIRGWIWVDPLVRKDYVPWDRLVDLGKAFQTCWGYERVLFGLQEKPALNERLTMDIVRRAHVEYEDVMRWCGIHLIRLLPYQDEDVRSKFTKVLHEFFDLG